MTLLVSLLLSKPPVFCAFDGDTDLAGHFGQIGHGLPGEVELGTVGGEREFDGSLRASAAGAASGSGAATVPLGCAD